MELRELARTLAIYNRWVNGQIYAAAARLSDEERRRPLGGAFASVHATLNHLLLADRAWLQRFHGEPVTMTSTSQELFADFDALRAGREATDAAIDAWAAAIEEGFADRPFRFFSVVYNRERTVPGWSVVLHFFNHQTHHRGQLTTLLRQLGQAPGVVDLPWMPLFDEPG